MSHKWLIGVGLALGASVVSNLGYNLQKLAHVKSAAKYEGKATRKKEVLAEYERRMSMSEAIPEHCEPDSKRAVKMKDLSVPENEQLLSRGWQFVLAV